LSILAIRPELPIIGVIGTSDMLETLAEPCCYRLVKESKGQS
jgi:hypothetical protein